MKVCNLLKRNGGGDRTRTCISFRTAVFKTAALPLCDPSEVYVRRNYIVRLVIRSTSISGTRSDASSAPGVRSSGVFEYHTQEN